MTKKWESLMNISIQQKKTLRKVVEDMVAYNIDYQPNPNYSGLHTDLSRLGLNSSEVQCIMRRVADGEV